MSVSECRLSAEKAGQCNLLSEKLCSELTSDRVDESYPKLKDRENYSIVKLTVFKQSDGTQTPLKGQTDLKNAQHSVVGLINLTKSPKDWSFIDPTYSDPKKYWKTEEYFKEFFKLYQLDRGVEYSIQVKFGEFKPTFRFEPDTHNFVGWQ